MPIGGACQQPTFTVSDVRRSQRPTRNTSIKSRDAQDPVPILVTGHTARVGERVSALVQHHHLEHGPAAGAGGPGPLASGGRLPAGLSALAAAAAAREGGR
jgi:hypothetical protein